MVKRFILATASVVLIFSASAFASGPPFNYSVSTAPVPTTEINAEESYFRVGLTYLSLKNSAPKNGATFDYDGGGIDVMLGRSINERCAFLWHTTAVDMAGMTSGVIEAFQMDQLGGGTFVDLPWKRHSNLFINNHDVTFLFQPFRTATIRPILFAGPALSWSRVYTSPSMDLQTLEAIHLGMISPEKSTEWTFLYGGQAGAVLGVKLGNFQVDPFVLIKEQWGTSTVGSVSAFPQHAYGAEAKHLPLGIAVSIVRHEAAASGIAGRVSGTIYQISWNHSWGGRR